MTNSKQKGKYGEIELMHLFKDYGFDSRRTAQYCGNTGDAADVTLEPRFHVECKRCERIEIMKWMAQAKRDHKEGTIPLVFFRQSRQPWSVCMDAEEFLKLLKYLITLENSIGIDPDSD